MRLYECESTCKVYEFPDQHCAFCKHCTDLLYDYTNGPYMFMCDLENVYYEERTCEEFEDDGYVFDEEDYKRRMDKLWEMFIAIGNPNPIFLDEIRSVLDSEDSEESED